MTLWALNQSFKSRSPLPQYLPSAHMALAEIMAKVEDLARSSRHKSADVGDGDAFEANDQLAILYGMAENEAIGEVCSIIEEVRDDLAEQMYRALTTVGCRGTDTVWDKDI